MAIMGIMERCMFSESGQYFACLGDDGKLKIWETETGVLKQEYTPNFHLGSPGTCIEWIKVSLETITPKKRKKLKTFGDELKETDAVAIGTASGSIFLYCLASGDVTATLNGGPIAPVNSLSWARGTNLFSSVGEAIIEWSVGGKTIESQWKTGKDVITQILVLPDGNSLLTASRSISLWNLPNRKKLKTFSGHASDVRALVFVPPVSQSSESYFVSSGATDRYLSAWSLNVENHSTAVAQFLMEDTAVHVCIYPGSKAEPTTMSAVTHSGVSHLYKLQLNGKSSKPIKAKLTFQIAAASGQNQNKEAVLPIPIIGAFLCNPSTVLLAHGSFPFLAFEKITPNYSKKVLCLVREDPMKTMQQIRGSISKIIEPVNIAAQYISSMGGARAGSSKRGHKVYCESPMEERLNNLTLNRSDASSGGVPHTDNVAHLLLQGLRSKDRRIVDTVLQQRDEAVIRRTVARLPVQVVVPLVQELTTLIQGKVMRCQVAAQWLRAVISVHASQILASPGATECFAPVLGLIETRLGMLTPLSKLRGRLDLLMDQLTSSQTKSSLPVCDSLLVYHDSYSSDEDSLAEEKVVQSDSDENWDYLSEAEESEMQDGELDAEMSGE